MKKDGDIASLFIQKICDKEDSFAFPGSGFEGRTNWTSMYAEVTDDMVSNKDLWLISYLLLHYICLPLLIIYFLSFPGRKFWVQIGNTSVSTRHI